MCRKKISLRLFELDRISDSCMLWMIRKWKEVGQVIFFVWYMLQKPNIYIDLWQGEKSISTT